MNSTPVFVDDVFVDSTDSYSEEYDDTVDEIDDLLSNYDDVVQLLEVAVSRFKTMRIQKKEVEKQARSTISELQQQHNLMRQSVERQKGLIEEVLSEKKAHAETLYALELKRKELSCEWNGKIVYTDGSLILKEGNYNDDNIEKEFYMQKSFELQQSISSLQQKLHEIETNYASKENYFLQQINATQLELEKKKESYNEMKQKLEQMTKLNQQLLEMELQKVGMHSNDKTNIIELYRKKGIDVTSIFDSSKKNENLNTTLKNENYLTPKHIVHNQTIDNYEVNDLLKQIEMNNCNEDDSEDDSVMKSVNNILSSPLRSVKKEPLTSIKKRRNKTLRTSHSVVSSPQKSPSRFTVTRNNNIASTQLSQIGRVLNFEEDLDNPTNLLTTTPLKDVTTTPLKETKIQLLCLEDESLSIQTTMEEVITNKPKRIIFILIISTIVIVGLIIGYILYVTM